MRLVLEGVAVDLGGCPIVAEADLVVEPGEFVGLVGPNGCGKSTLLRSIYRALRPAAGLISLDGDDLWRLPAKEAARRVAVVAQESPTDMDFTVKEVVALGRTPHKRPLDRDTGEDHAICRDALDRVGMTGAHQRTYTTLSGGEKQRVLVARALAQRSHLHLLDEPTNHLDVRYQLEILGLVRGLGHSTLAAIHDLNLAAAQDAGTPGGRTAADRRVAALRVRPPGVPGVPLACHCAGTPRVIADLVRQATRDVAGGTTTVITPAARSRRRGPAPAHAHVANASSAALDDVQRRPEVALEIADGAPGQPYPEAIVGVEAAPQAARAARLAGRSVTDARPSRRTRSRCSPDGYRPLSLVRRCTG